MTVGTKSVLYGFHQFILHPIILARAWTALYGFPLDPRLWICFFVHDLGYIGKPNMDGDEGESHPLFGARIMSIFGKEWGDFALLHSRFYSKKLGRNISKLCIADKLAICLCPRWLWKALVRATGEWKEYIAATKYAENSDLPTSGDVLGNKYDGMVAFLNKWIEDNKNTCTQWP